MSLATEHLQDLARSGIDSTTAQKLLFTAVSPHRITIQGASSAYRLPYFNLDGTQTCFERLRLFPPIKRPDGSTQKYFQEAGTTAYLYLPPLQSWQIIAGSGEHPLMITEGEKKAAAGCLRGLAVVGVAGVWNWRQNMDAGQQIIIPTLDQFVWKSRTVELIPDSDAWREHKLLKVLSGFYALGQELISRGAVVRLVRLPERGAVKVGLDDWLVQVGDEWQILWPSLERISLDDLRLKDLAAWWQRWREKQALDERFRSEQADDMDLSQAAGLYRVAFSSHRVIFQFDRLTDARGGVSAELTVILGSIELLGSTDIGLKADSARDKISRTLATLSLNAKLPWKRLLERACTAVLKRHREGTPVVELEPDEHTSTHVPFILNPLIYRGHQTLAFAPGGSCKSYLALYFALLACHGRMQTGVGAIKTPVLYLDWELDEATVTGRLKAIQNGHPELGYVRPFYRRCEYPLHKDVHQIAAHVANLCVQFLIIDSAALACGGDLASPDSAILLQRALRTVGCASLVLAHVPKSIQEGQEATAYGTVFFRELARNVWEFQRTNDGNPVRVALHQKKNNFGPPLPPLGFEITFQEDSVHIASFNPEDEPECEARLPTSARIRTLLEDGNMRTADEIATELGAKLATVKSELSRHKGRKWHMFGGAGEPTKWSVLSVK
jgi:hypothetical protein